MKWTTRLTNVLGAMSRFVVALALLVLAITLLVGDRQVVCVSSDLSRWPTAEVRFGECGYVGQDRNRHPIEQRAGDGLDSDG